MDEVVADRDVGIARDAEGRAVHDPLAGEELLGLGRHDVFEQDIAIAAIGGERHEAAERAADGNDRKPRLLLAVARRQPDRHVQQLVRQEREIERLVDRHRREDRGHFVAEELVDNLLLAIVQFGRRQAAHAGLGELRLELFEEAAVLVRRHAVNAGGNSIELLADRHAGRVGGRILLVLDELQSTDADHEEFVEIAGADRQELQSFEQGNVRVVRFVQNALIELQPAEFTIEIARRCVGHDAKSKWFCRAECDRWRVQARPLRSSTFMPNVSSNSEPFCMRASCSNDKSSTLGTVITRRPGSRLQRISLIR